MALPIPIVDTLIDTVRDIGGKIIDRVWPDKVAQEKERLQAELELWKLTQVERMQDKANEIALATGQMDINKVEAANSSIFISGWRPWIGWVCGMAFFYCYLASPLIVQIAAVNGVAIPKPDLNIGEMMTVLLGMLGLGGLRTMEKLKGVATK